MVEYTVRAPSGTPAPAEVSQTPTYLTQHATLHSVVLRLPDTRCHTPGGISATTRTVTAAATPTGDGSTMNSACSVWLAELERSLSQSGYRVISWDALLRAERTQNVSTYVAAQRLGADAVFVVNDLSTSTIFPDLAAGSSIVYYHSDSRGEGRTEIALPSQTRTVLHTFVTNRVGLGTASDPTRQPTALSATLNVTGILASSGESMWFYRRTLVHPLASVTNRRFLFRGRDTFWRPVMPELVETPGESSRDLTSREEVSVSSATGTVDPFETEKHGLTQAVVHDFIARFRGETRGTL